MFPKYANRYDYNVKKACIAAGFDLSEDFLATKNAYITGVWNGLGAAGDWFNDLIPKRVWWLNVEIISCPHDFDYQMGRNWKDKRRADRRLLKNGLIWVRSNTKNKWLRRLREAGIYKYYLAVKWGGSRAFWKGKGKNI